MKQGGEKVKDETRCVDNCECIYCGCRFDGKEAMNGDMDRSTVECPYCGQLMSVSVSIEYLCTPIEE